MLDDATTGASASLPRCMWCSAELPSDSETTCPSCGATLIGEGVNPVPGVTAIDAEAIIRNARAPKAKQRGGRLISWISGEYQDDDEAPAPPGSLSPPPPAVRRELLRLELEARVANLQAEAGAIVADAAVEAGTPIDLTDIEATAALATAGAGATIAASEAVDPTDAQADAAPAAERVASADDGTSTPA
jgi:hypothetical protein